MNEAMLYNLNVGSSKHEVMQIVIEMQIKHLYEDHSFGIREIARKFDMKIKEVKEILHK